MPLGITYETLQGNIVLLSILNRYPGVQAEHEIPLRYRLEALDPPSRNLALQRECELVNILAFLAGRSDHPGEVTALCIEESTAGGTLIRLA
jgi:hypothetical protein